MPAARFHSYSDTHELELHERSWRCRWCHAQARALREACTGNRPPPKRAFIFKKPTARAVRRAKGRRLWGRKQARRHPARVPRPHRPGAALRAGLHVAWPAALEACQLHDATSLHEGSRADTGAACPPNHVGRPPEGEAGII